MGRNSTRYRASDPSRDTQAGDERKPAANPTAKPIEFLDAHLCLAGGNKRILSPISIEGDSLVDRTLDHASTFQIPDNTLPPADVLLSGSTPDHQEIHMKRAPFAALIATILVATITLTLTAGPPLICHPYEIGNANCLPWGKDRWEAPRQLKRNLVEQVLDRLDATMPAIVRMETIRRAVIAAGNDGSVVGRELVARLMARALDAEAAGRTEAMAWFDVGFLVQSMDQFNVCYVRGLGVNDNIVGYAWIARGLQLRGTDDPQMNFAAALVTALYDPDKSAKHMDIARAGAVKDRLLAANIKRFKSELGKHLDHHRRNYQRSHGG